MKKNRRNTKLPDMRSSFDVLGSYTGVSSSSKDEEKPVQDADDL